VETLSIPPKDLAEAIGQLWMISDMCERASLPRASLRLRTITTWLEQQAK
jgi:hypothetical protein